MITSTAGRWAAAALAVPVALTIGSAAAGAATTHGTVSATTKITTRYDSGGAGNWAYDGTRSAPMDRVVTFTYLGKGGPAADPYQYEVTLTDSKGDFQTIPGALTPNQGGRDAGRTEPATQLTGTINGFADYTVDASAKVSNPREFANLGVPVALRGVVQNAAYPTSTYPENAFPAGTTFNVNLFDWGWTYEVPAKVTVVHGHKHTTKAQTWVDSLANGAGQDTRDGNIG
jgi:hypothetical protein